MTTASPASKRTVLVVDDSATARLHTVGALRKDFVCLEAADGNEAFELAKTQDVAAVVTDLEMPNGGGLALLRLMHGHERTKKIPVVVVTTVTSVEVINSCRALGCAGIVLKPVDPAYLLAKLRKLTTPVSG